MSHRGVASPIEFARLPTGQCRWCGLAILNVDGSPNLRRNWHEDCVHIFKMCNHPTYARDVVFQRDNGVCAYCDADTVQDSRHWKVIRHHSEHTVELLKDGSTVLYCSFRYKPAWDVEHEIPLWKTADMPRKERIKYFTLDALKTACLPCHKRKTAEEAAERAHIKRLGDQRNGKTKNSGVKIKSRGFDKTRTRGFDQKVKPRMSSKLDPIHGENL